MNNYSKKERLENVLEITNSLKNFKGKDNTPVNLFNDEYSFIKKFKEIYTEYINNDSPSTKELRGKLFFEEIGKYVEYSLPYCKKNKKLFVIRIK